MCIKTCALTRRHQMKTWKHKLTRSHYILSYIWYNHKEITNCRRNRRSQRQMCNLHWRSFHITEFPEWLSVLKKWWQNWVYVALQTTVLGLFARVFLQCQWVQTYHSIHSKIPLTWHPWNWTGTRLSDIIIHNLKWPQFLQIIFCYCSYTLDVQLLRVFHLGISFICWFRAIRVFFCILWSLHSWKYWWSRRQGVSLYPCGW